MVTILQRQALTAAQQRVLDALVRSIEQHGFPPSTRELAASLGISTPSTHEQLRRLETKGYISRIRGKARSIEVLAQSPASGEPATRARARSVPVLGRIAAGRPILAQEHVTDHVWVDERAAGHGQLFALRVEGESMCDAGINDGDLVVVRQQPVAESGDIVAALLYDDATVKRLKIDNERIILLPANKAYDPLDVTLHEEFRILGKVVTWLRPS